MRWYLAPEPQPSVLPVPTVQQLLMTPAIVTAADPAQAMLEALKVSPEQAAAVEQCTRGQTDNPLWSAYRQGRITASNVGSVIKCCIDGKPPSKSLTKTLMGQYDLIGVRAIHWGQNHESVAREMYESLNGVTVQPCGLFLHTNGVFGGSPDGQVSSEKIIEIKCPYSAKDKPVTELLTEGFYIHHDTQGLACLNYANQTGYKYFHQVQANLFLTGASQCDFIVWSPAETLIFTVERDASWTMNIPLLTDFYCKHFLPILMKGTTTTV